MNIDDSFTTQAALLSALGGVLIGLASALLLASQGRIAGVSGIAGRLFVVPADGPGWRIAFLGGLLVGGVALNLASPELIGRTGWASLPQLALAGLLVGYGTQLGNGCTSGHGVCGLARRSQRSLVATLTFMGAAGVVVFALRHVVGA